jgi:hypothetical protein
MHLNYGVHILVVYYGGDTSELTNGGSGKVDPIVWGLKIGEETFSMALIDIDDVQKRNI